jgi:hypothetical protein
VSYSGFVNGDTSASLTTAATASVSAVPGSAVGSYSIVPSGASSANYDISYADGILNVTKAQLLVIGNNASRAVGVPDPEFTATITGLLAGDGITPVFSAEADISSPPGVYYIDLNLDDPLGRLGSYDVTLIGGELTVTNSGLIGTVTSATRFYGQTNAAFTVSYTGFLNGDTSNVLQGAMSYSCLSSNGVPTGTNTSVGSYPIHVTSGQTAENYTVHYVDGTLTIAPAVLLVTPDNMSRLFGRTNPVLTATYTGYVNNEGSNVITGQPDLQTDAEMFSPIGAYDITASLGTLSATNYTFGFTNATLTIGQAVISVVADSQTRTYGATNAPLTVHYSGFMEGDDTNVLQGAPVISTLADTNSPVGTYSIVVSAGTLSATNYAFSYTNGAIIVTPAILTVSADDQMRSYGSPNPALTVSYSGFVNGQDTNVLTSLPTVGTAADVSSGAGDYAIELTGGAATNYAFNLVEGNLEITQAPLLITADSQTRAYGSANPELTISYSGFVNGDTSASLNSIPTISATADTSSPVGDYAIDVSSGGDQNYDITLVGGTLSVTQVALTISADDQTRPYGSANPELTVSYSGLVNGDTSASLTTPATASVSAVLGSAVGSYPIIPSGASSPNYNVFYTDGTLTVTKAELLVIGNNASRGFGAPNPEFTASITGLLAGDDITPVFSPEADITSPSGEYYVDVNLNDPDSRLGSYDVTLIGGELTVTNAGLTGTVASSSRLYGQTNAAFTVSYTGFLNGDTANVLQGTMSYSCLTSNGVPTDTNTAVGSYPIHVSSGQTAGNYTIHYVDGTLTVAPAVLLVTPDNASRLFGTTNPVFAATYSGYANNEGSNVFSGHPDLETTASVLSPIGVYDITATQGTLSATNYTFMFTNGALTVGQAVISVVADDQSRTYGATNVPLTVRYSGFIDGDGTNVLQGAPVIYTLANTNSAVGTYAIAVSAGTLNATNYAFTFTNGAVHVTQASLMVTADDKSRSYGSPNPALTVSYSGFVNGQSTDVLQSPPTVATTAVVSSDVGDYPITLTGGSDTNYAFTLGNGNLHVTRAQLVATANSQSRVYGAANPTLGISYSGFVNGQDPSVLEALPTASTIANPLSSVGDYSIALSGGNDQNYAVMLVNGTLSVTPAGLTIAANNQTRPYGSANPILTFSYSGFVNGQDASALTQLPTLSTEATPASAVGAYPIIVFGGFDSNYSIVRVNASLQITAKALTIAANSATRAFGTANPVFTGTISGLVNADPISATYNSAALLSSPAGTYQIVPTLVDPDSLAGNYTLSFLDAALDVTAALTLNGTSGVYAAEEDALPLDTNATVADGGSLNFAGGTVIVTSETNVGGSDELAIEPDGSGPGEINIQGALITYGGVPFASFTASPSALNVTLGSNNVTSTMLTALLRHMTFATGDTNTVSRLIQIALNYGDIHISARRALLLNRPPVANDIEIMAVRGVNITVPYAEILTNATDPDGDTISVAGVSLVSANGGRISTSANSLTYQPPINFTGGDDLIAYLISDDRGGETVGVIDIDFIATNVIQIDTADINTTGLQLTMGGTPGRVYQVQTSTDLRNWTLLETVTATPTGIITVLDEAAKTLPHRFYRAVAQ